MRTGTERHWRSPAVIAALAATLALTSCETVRKVTYPPDFVYLPQKQVRDAMTRMSIAIGRVDTILAAAPMPSAAERAELISVLAGIERTALELGAGGRATNHLLIDQNIDEFKDDVSRARADVEREPPSYYLAGRLSGRCLACHILGR